VLANSATFQRKEADFFLKDKWLFSLQTDLFLNESVAAPGLSEEHAETPEHINSSEATLTIRKCLKKKPLFSDLFFFLH